MMEEILRAALGQGLYAAMFVALLFWVLKKNEERERSLHRLLQEQTAVLQEISRRLLSLDTRFSRAEIYWEKGVASYGEERHRRFQMAGDDRLEPGSTVWNRIRNDSGGDRPHIGSEL